MHSPLKTPGTHVLSHFSGLGFCENGFPSKVLGAAKIAGVWHHVVHLGGLILPPDLKILFPAPITLS
jgi:hypothetical protein